MRSLAFTGVALVALMAAQPVLAAIDSGVGAPHVSVSRVSGPDDRAPHPLPPPPPAPMMGGPDDRSSMPAPPPMMANPDNRMEMRSPPHRMQRAFAYARPSYGFQLPREWMSPDYFIADYRAYGLARPAPGFGWSHYQGDVVLSDQWGRVYDVADGRPDHGGHGFGSRDTDGLAGGVAGAAVGAVAGNVIAGAGSRLAGSLIGGGVGALAGLAVEAALSKHHRRERHHDDRWGYDDGYYRSDHAHWGGYPQQAWSYQGCNCGGGETVTTTVVTHGGGGYIVPRRVVTYENVYAPVQTKYRVREFAPTKYHVRETAPVSDGKTRVRLHTKKY